MWLDNPFKIYIVEKVSYKFCERAWVHLNYAFVHANANVVYIFSFVQRKVLLDKRAFHVNLSTRARVTPNMGDR